MPHNEKVKTFSDIQHYLELEAKCLEVAKASSQLYVAKFSTISEMISWKNKVKPTLKKIFLP